LKSNELYIENNQKSDTLFIKFINTTQDTVYLFKSYFSEELYSSKYLHWIDNKSKTYTISFVPLVSNLATIRSDRISVGENSVGMKGQILYSFIELAPNTYFTLSVNIRKLFKNQYQRNNAVCSQNYMSLNKFEQAKFQFLTTSRLKSTYKLIFAFGIYKDVSFICDQANYFLKEFEFNNQAKSFKVIKSSVQLSNDKPKMLK